MQRSLIHYSRMSVLERKSRWHPLLGVLSFLCLNSLLHSFFVTAAVNELQRQTTRTARTATKQTAAATISYEDPASFEHYDYQVLDPYDVHGAPYGGYSRNTRSRLSALPLYLPDQTVAGDNNDDDDEEDSVNDHSKNGVDDSFLYWKVRNDEGRLFACRLYSQDELDPKSLEEGMFVAPRLYDGTSTTASSKTIIVADENDPPSTSSGESPHSPTKPEQTPIVLNAASGEVQIPSDDSRFRKASLEEKLNPANQKSNLLTKSAMTTAADDVDSDYESSTKATSSSKRLGNTFEEEKARKILVLEQRMHEHLSDVCAQIHKGWWSYEWCYEKTNTQFHIEYDGKTNKVNVEDVSDLGTFGVRTVDFDFNTPNLFAQKVPELARVTDFYSGGAACPSPPIVSTGDAKKNTAALTTRQTFVNMKCCSPTIMQRRPGMVHRLGRQVPTDVAAILEVTEDPDLMCSYNITVCSPVLCGETLDELSKAVPTSTTSGEMSDNDEPSVGLVPSSTPFHDLTILQILDRALTKLCLQSSLGGWWTYEVCHRDRVRQFHETTGMRRNAAGAKVTTRVVESEHVLGKYPDVIALDDSDKSDHERVVNATSADSSWGEGNGAYYEIEYSGGDVCDHTDVTDSAVVAGSTGAAVVKRASTVRYFCGQSFDVAVTEDSTCHYIVNVKVPDLCRHALFRAPISKRQIIKCLPVDERNT